MPRVTALTPDRTGGQVLVELDGELWRRIPVEVAMRVGLATHAELERRDFRRLRRELRRGEALDAATRALRHRDRSSATVRARLVDSGIAPWACEQALDALTRAGVLDDARFARARARSLADRGSSDALIRADLIAGGVAEAQTDEAIAELEPERERAIGLAATRGHSVATARWLTRRGFGEESIGAALPSIVAGEP